MVLRNARDRGHKVDEAIFRIKPPKVERRERHLSELSWEEVHRSPTPSYRNLILFAALTGLREGEPLGLRDRDLALEARTLHVENGAYKRKRPPEDEGEPSVDLSRGAQRVLREQLLARVPNEHDPVFPSPGVLVQDA